MNREKPIRKKKSERKGKLRLQKLWAKPYRFSAHVTEEQDWQTEVPNVKLARVFGVVLVLHVVAVGGILAFKIFERTSTMPEESSVVSTDPAPSAEPRTPVKVKAAPENEVNVIVDDPSRLGMKHYRVRSGDNLLAVARRLEVSVSELEQLNKLDKGNELYAGQVLLVPNYKISALPDENIERLLLGEKIPETVVKAETLSAIKPVEIAEAGPVVRAAVPMEQAVPAGPETVIARAEPIEAPAAVVSQPVLRPAAGPPPAPVVRPAAPALAAVKPAASPASRTMEPPAPATRSYVVQPGDTPYGIGRRFGVDPQTLMRVNGIEDPRFLSLGQELRIP